MSKEFVATLYTLQPLADARVMQRVWAHLDTPLVQPRRYDVIERTRKRFSPEAYTDAAALYREKGFLLVRGGKDGFVVTFSRVRNGMSVWRFYLNAGAVNGKRRDLWLQWLFELCEALPVLYGYACSTAEHEARHLVVKDLPGGEQFARMHGDSVREFFQYMPGIYWLTLFGKELHQTFKARWPLLEGQAKVKFLTGGQVAVQLAGPVFPKDMAERLQTGRDIAGVLGTQYFFDQARMGEMEFKAAPELTAVLGPWRPHLTPEAAAQILRACRMSPVGVASAVVDFMNSARIGYEDAVAAYLTLGMPVDVCHIQRTALFSAVQGGQPEIIRLLVASGADLEARDPDDDTPLITVAERGHLEVLHTLIELGANVTAVSRKHGTPFIQTILHKRRAFLRPLIAAGADVNATYGENGYTPLYYSIVAKDAQCAMGLVLFDADINARVNPHNRPLLTCALLNKQWGVAKVLIAAGADLNATDDLGWTPWRIANYEGWTPWHGLQFLFWDSWNMPKAEEEAPDVWKNLVVTAGLLGWMNWRKHLSAAGVKMEFPPEHNLLSAAKAGDVEGLQAALAAGANINALDPHGHTALAVAGSQGQVAAVCYLLERGAVAEPPLPANQSPLMIAVSVAQQLKSEREKKV